MPYKGAVANVRNSPALGADTLASAIRVKGALWVDTTNPDALKWYRYDGTTWKEIGAVAPPVPGWALGGNTLTGTERLGSNNSQPVRMYTNNLERIRILSNGNTVIGSATFADVSRTLHVGGTASVTAEFFVVDNALGTTYIMANTGLRCINQVNLRNAGGGGHAWFTMQLAQLLPTPNADNAGNIVGYQSLNSTGTVGSTFNRVAWVTVRGNDLTEINYPNRRIGLMQYGGRSQSGLYADVVLQWDGTNNRGNVGVGGLPRAKAKLDVQSTVAGFSPPVMTTDQRDAMALVASDEGMMIFNTTTKKHEGWDGVTWNAFY